MRHTAVLLGAEISRTDRQQQGWTSAARVVAIDITTGRYTPIYNPNPQLAGRQFTPVKKYVVTVENGEAAVGHFVYPAGFRPGTRYPRSPRSVSTPSPAA